MKAVRYRLIGRQGIKINLWLVSKPDYLISLLVNIKRLYKTEFNRTFDSVKRLVVIEVLEKFSFGQPLLTLFKYCRRRRVKVLGFKSNEFFNIIRSASGGVTCPRMCFRCLSKTSCFAPLSPTAFCLWPGSHMRVNNLNNCRKFHSKLDLNRFIFYFYIIDLSLYIFECKTMTFNRNQSLLL